MIAYGERALVSVNGIARTREASFLLSAAYDLPRVYRADGGPGPPVDANGLLARFP